ncbi:protein STPG4 [Aplochiton taeniatus]
MSMSTEKNTVTSKLSVISKEGDSTEEKGKDKDYLGDRGSWWWGTLKDTPIPGRYHIRDFIEEAGLNPVRRTYGFKDLGRAARMQSVKKGDLLLPGAYSFTDSTQELLHRQASYSFKNCPRPDRYTLGIRDKEIDLSPCHYNMMAKPVDKMPCKHVMFRSAVQRVSFLPRLGPCPGQYNPRTGLTNGITSCFKSTTPRLQSVRSRTPGPGAYEPPWLTGQTPGGEVSHGLLFRSAF